MAKPFKSKGNRWLRKYGLGMLFYMPFFLLFFVFTILPVLISIGMSFMNYDMMSLPEWVGLNNYRLLFLTDDVFLLALKNTLIIAVIAGPAGYFCSFFFAWVINNMRMKNMFALAFYAPSITSGVAMSTVWLYFFSGDRYGLINNALMKIGVISEPIVWNQNPNTILPVIIFIQIWMSMGTGFLVFLAGLQNTDRELYEAARIDGIRSSFQELFYITLPQMKPQLLFGAINTTVAMFGVYDIAVGFAGFPSADYAGHTLVAHIYDYAFLRFEMGYASASSVFLFLITFLLGRLFMRILSEKHSS